MATPPDFEVIVGTYEEYLLGYKLKSNNERLELKQSFATHEHSSSLRTVSTCGKYLASGGADDRICVYDMVSRKEHVMLTHHNSTVNCLEFTTGNTHLISSSMDGFLSITRVGNWVLETNWEKAHKNGYVTALAVHPSGKLALTLGSDCTLQTWNLIKGRKAYIINLNSKSTDAKSLNFIKWGPCEEKFILGGGDNIEIWNISTGGILKKFSYKSKVTCATWLSEKLIVIGHENGKLTVLNIESGTSEEYEAYTNRVKCLEFKKNYLITASSSGSIKTWSFSDEMLLEVNQCNAGCRITCMAIVDGIKVKKQEKVDDDPLQNDISENTQFRKIHTKQRIIIEEDSEDEAQIVEIKKKQKGNSNILSSEITKKKKNKKRKSNNGLEQKNEIEVADELPNGENNKKTKNKKLKSNHEDKVTPKKSNKSKRRSDAWVVENK